VPDFTLGLIHLTNWLGNVILPTLCGSAFAAAAVQFSKGHGFGHYLYGGMLCLVVSGMLRLFETFASASGWNDPDLYWIALRTLVNWVCNVIMPVYAALQVALGVATVADVGYRYSPTYGPVKHFLTALVSLSLSGLVRLAEFFVTNGTAVVSGS
jgi:hypothetical protein